MASVALTCTRSSTAPIGGTEVTRPSGRQRTGILASALGIGAVATAAGQGGGPVHHRASPIALVQIRQAVGDRLIQTRSARMTRQHVLISLENRVMHTAMAQQNGDETIAAVAPRGELAARHLAMPADTNPSGNIFGGWIMAAMDAAAGMTTTRLAEGQTVTVAVSNMVFMQPIKVGDTVCFYTDVKRIGRTSIALDVEVWVLRRGCGQRVKVTQAEFTFVVVDEDGRPRPINGETDRERLS